MSPPAPYMRHDISHATPNATRCTYLLPALPLMQRSLRQLLLLVLLILLSVVVLLLPIPPRMRDGTYLAPKVCAVFSLKSGGKDVPTYFDGITLEMLQPKEPC